MPGAALCYCCLAPAAHAVDAIVLEVRELTRRRHSGGRRQRAPRPALRQTNPRDAAGARAPRCPIPSGKFTRSRARVRRAGDRRAALRLRCRDGSPARGGPTGSHRHAGRAPRCAPTPASPRSAARGLKVAGTTATFDGRLDDKGWQVKGRTGTTTVAALRKFAAPWFELPADITGDGKVASKAAPAMPATGTVVDATLNLDGGRPHQRGQHHRHRQARRRPRACARASTTPTPRSQLDVAGKQGQVLVNPVLLDFGKNPLALEVRGNAERRRARRSTRCTSRRPISSSSRAPAA